MTDYRKFWRRVITALDDLEEGRDCSAYSLDNLLCIPLDNFVTISLGLDGKGYVLNKNHPFGESISLRVYQPVEISHKVLRAYRQVKWGHKVY
jgi:hypothetical protein